MCAGASCTSDWRKRFGAMDVADTKKLKQLAAENARLKKLLAERDLDVEVMKEIAAKHGERDGPSAPGGLRLSPRSLGSSRLSVTGSARSRSSSSTPSRPRATCARGARRRTSISGSSTGSPPRGPKSWRIHAVK